MNDFTRGYMRRYKDEQKEALSSPNRGAQPEQRSEASTWVGLTDKEIGVLWFEANDQDNSMIKHFARAIEAKLKAKNERLEKNT